MPNTENNTTPEKLAHQQKSTGFRFKVGLITPNGDWIKFKTEDAFTGEKKDHEVLRYDLTNGDGGFVGREDVQHYCNNFLLDRI